MPRKKSYLTATDHFCGAGGSSQGAKNAGVEVKMALNHWKLAIDTHSHNFPETDHDCTDISACDPRRYPSTDIGIFSPECTTHSPAGGNTHRALKQQMDLFSTGKINPATERSRATMWDVVRFTEYHGYELVFVENVVEAMTRWALFESWLNAMHNLGYMHRCVFLNSMHCHPTPQSRDRMYVVFWKKGNKAPVLDYTPLAHCPKCSRDVRSVQTWKNKQRRYGKYRTQYVYCCPACSTVVEPYYYAAFNCIDWSDLGTRIGERKKPLAEKTVARIQYGLDKYGRQPLQVISYTPGYTKPLACATGTLTATDSHGLMTPLEPFTVLNHTRHRAHGMGGAMPTQTTSEFQGLVTPQPFLVDNKQTTGIGFRVRGTDQVTCTMHTEPGVGLVSPFLVDSAYSGRPRSVAEEKRAQTSQHTEGIVVAPLIIENKGRSKARASSAPLATQACKDTHAALTPPIITELQGTGKARPATRELNGVTAGGIHSGIVTPDAWQSFIAHYYGTHNTNCIAEALGTVTTNDRSAVISYQTPRIEDCYYRMLYPPEIQRAMAFADSYVVLGSSKDKVKQLGNAVTPPAMEWLIGQGVKSLS